MKKSIRFLCLSVLLLFRTLCLWAGGVPEISGDGAEPSLGDGPAWLAEEGEDYIVLIDAAGDRVRVDKPVSTVAANGMGELFTTLRALRAEEMIAASTEYVTRNEGFFPRISRLPSISSNPEQVDQELLITLDPDVIFCIPSFYSQLGGAVTESFPVVQVDFESVEDIRMVGAVLDREEEAEAYIRWIEGYTQMIDRRIAPLKEEELQKVFLFYGGEYGMVPPPPYGTFGRENPRNELIRRAGGISLTEELPGAWITVDPEWLVREDPPMLVRECYLTGDAPPMGYNLDSPDRARRFREEILAQPALSTTTAAQEGRMLMIYGDLFEDSWFLAQAYLAKAFHPELFADLDLRRMHREFLQDFQGLDFDPSSRGVFAYPDL